MLRKPARNIPAGTDHSQRDCGDCPQDQTEGLFPNATIYIQDGRTNAGPSFGHGSDDPLRSTGAGHMDVFHVQLGKILADVPGTPDI